MATTTVDEPRVRVLPFGWVAAAVASIQGIAFGLLAARGFFYQDDLDYTAQAAGRGLSLDYLLSPNNDHVAPGLRLAYWLVAHAAPYEQGLTVAARIAVQAVATLLFARLLVRLYGPRPVAVVALAGYASAILTLPSFLSLSSAVNLLPSHVAVILLLDGWLRYQLTGRLRYAVTGAVALLVGLLFWEKIALAVLLLPLFTLTVLTAGPARDRWRALRSRWPGLAVSVLPVLAYAALYLARRPGDGPGPTPSVTGFLHLAGISGAGRWRRRWPAAPGGGSPATGSTSPWPTRRRSGSSPGSSRWPGCCWWPSAATAGPRCSRGRCRWSGCWPTCWSSASAGTTSSAPWSAGRTTTSPT